MNKERTIGDLGEQGFFDLFRDRFAEHTRGLVLGTGDDVAITAEPEPGRRLVWTIDTMVQGTHFRFWRDVRPGTIAGKLAASNLSDLASKGARPLYALLSLGIPPTTPITDLDDFYAGLGSALSCFGTRLIGGDTVRAPMWVLTLALAGDLDARAPVAARHRARPGQSVYVTGHPGESGAGFRILEADRADWRDRFPDLAGRHLEPTPRVAEGQALVARFEDLAMLDLSDGVAVDAARIARASGVRLMLEEDLLPISESLQAFARESQEDPIRLFLNGGEDYELLFTTAAEDVAVRAAFATPVRRIGRVEEGSGLVLRTKDGQERPISPEGFEHFS